VYSVNEEDFSDRRLSGRHPWVENTVTRSGIKKAMGQRIGKKELGKTIRRLVGNGQSSVKKMKAGQAVTGFRNHLSDGTEKPTQRTNKLI